MVFVESSDSITQSLVSVREESLIYSAVIYAKYLLQGRHKVWKSGGGAWSTVVGIICPPGWDRVNCLAKNWGAKAPPPLATALRDWLKDEQKVGISASPLCDLQWPGDSESIKPLSVLHSGLKREW